MPGKSFEAAVGTEVLATAVVSLDTVKKHLSHLLAKLGAASRIEAVARARQEIPPPVHFRVTSREGSRP